MLTLNDGRSELWQWDTGRTLAVDADCSQVHFSNKVFGRSIDVDVIGGSAIIPDVLLQTDKDLNVWAFVGTAENGYTKIGKTFKVNRRNKPADYVFTPTDQMTMQTIQSQIGDLADLTTEAKDTLVAAINEAARTGGGGGGASVELDTTLTQSGKAADAKATGDAIRSLSEEIANLQTSGLTTAQVKALDGMFKVAAYIKADVSAEYSAFKTAFGIEDSGDTEPEKTLTSISVTYSGGSVPAGTALGDLTGIVVTAHYSDGSTATVTGYTLSGTLTEGTSTITVSYGGKTDTFDVTVTPQNDTTAEIATEGYVFSGPGNLIQRENGGITVKYQLDAPTTVFHPAGIIPVLFANVGQSGNIVIYKDNNYVDYFSEFETVNVGRWAQLASGELAEYSSKSWDVAEYNQISFSVDMRCIDDAYMYDYTSGQVWFAGKNTPYYGKTNISEVVA